jgi:hypothetical protein
MVIIINIILQHGYVSQVFSHNIYLQRYSLFPVISISVTRSVSSAAATHRTNVNEVRFQFSRRRVWSFQPSGTQRHAVSFKHTVVTEGRAASVMVMRVEWITWCWMQSSSSETSVCFNDNTRRCIPEGCNLYNVRLKCCLNFCTSLCQSIRRSTTIYSNNLNVLFLLTITIITTT